MQWAHRLPTPHRRTRTRLLHLPPLTRPRRPRPWISIRACRTTSSLSSTSNASNRRSRWRNPSRRHMRRRPMTAPRPMKNQPAWTCRSRRGSRNCSSRNSKRRQRESSNSASRSNMRSCIVRPWTRSNANTNSATTKTPGHIHTNSAKQARRCCIPRRRAHRVWMSISKTSVNRTIQCTRAIHSSRMRLNSPIHCPGTAINCPTVRRSRNGWRPGSLTPSASIRNTNTASEVSSSIRANCWPMTSRIRSPKRAMC